MNDVLRKHLPVDTAPESFGVVVADNDHHIRGALADLIHDHPRLHLVGTAVDGVEAARLCGEHRAHLAVIDVRMPFGGAHAVDLIKAASPSTVVAAYTTLTDRRTRQRLLEAGAVAVFHKGGGYDLGDEFAALLTT